MYLSKCTLAPREARNPYLIHKAVWKLFPGMADADRPFLFRLGPARPGRSPELLLQSHVKPTPSDDGACRIVAGPKPFEPVLQKGQLLRFALTANPTKRLAKERSRVPLIDNEQLTEWLARQLTDAVLLHDVQMDGRQELRFRKKAHAGKINTVSYSGLMEVLDPEALGNKLRTGIGRAKSFGCGLLSIARA